jgi:two-component system sensor histidine kinase/response regulator
MSPLLIKACPTASALDLIRDLMQLRPTMGLVMYTVRDDIGLAHSLHSLGATFLTKPASRIGLGEAVKSAARQYVGLDIVGPKRLLIAEDTDSVRDILKRQLEIMGIEADFVIDGEEAIKAYRTGKYGIMFTDLHMPIIDGYGVAETIRTEEKETGKHFPLIVLTADIQLSQRTEYQKHGFDECLLKPVTLGQLRRLLIRWNLLQEEDSPPIPSLTPKVQKTITEKPAIDLECLKQQMGTIDQDTVRMMGMFVTMTNPLIEKIITYDREADYPNLTEAAHSLKGSARSACCNILGDLAARVQEDSSRNKSSSEIVAKIVTEFARIKIEVSQMKI